MKKLVAIGGGNMKTFETLEIDKQIVALANKHNPKVLFIPTAGNDEPHRFDDFNKIYRNILGCDTDVLYLIEENPSYQEIEEKIFSSDVVYIGGGSTVRLIENFFKNKIEDIIVNAYKNGIIIAGLSAGSLYLFDYGISGEPEGFVKVKGLGFIPASHCPHFSQEERRKAFFDILSDGEIGIGLDDNCALFVVDGKYKLITPKEKLKATLIRKLESEIKFEEIDGIEEFSSLASLLN
jgi:dipeptidase E